MPAILELRDVRKTYGDVLAVDNVSLALEQGEFLTLLGPSGSGKTTTLQLVAGLAVPTAGVMLLDGKPLGPLPPYLRNIGVVFQQYALFPHMNVGKNVAFPLEMRRMARSDIVRKVGDVLALVGLPGYEDRYPRQLSGGQQQRVALARAMVFGPRLLLMDEPLGALDRKLREQIQIEIMRLHQELGMSIVYVTHDQEEALVMSDRIAIFNRGCIEQIGTSAELYERPGSRFVAGFLGESNFFPGVMRDLANGYCCIDCGGLALRARSGGGLVQGALAVLTVRPERIRLMSPENNVENSVVGNVRDVIYLGRSRKYIVRVQGDIEVVVYQNVQEAGAQVLAFGDPIRLAWHADDATALPDVKVDDATAVRPA
jgi:putative spermidine/putrescine transport system ATP-binding protein